MMRWKDLNTSKLNKKGFCVIIPAYNESKRILSLMVKIDEFLKFHKDCWVLISDDGSEDDTVNKIEKLNTSKRLKVLKCSHQGKWGALRDGFFAAKHEKVVFLDADLSVDFETAVKAAVLLEENDVIAGDRYGSEKSAVPFKRRVLSKGFSGLVRFLANLDVLDSQCPLKAMRKTKQVCVAMGVMRERGFVGDIEFFILLKRWGVGVRNMSVRYVFKQGGFKAIKNTLRMFAGLIRVCWRYAGPVMLR